MRAIIVSVDYSDLLSITLPYNRHHFTDVCIVTAPHDTETQRIALENSTALHITKAFYANGAVFNKWAALEEGFDAFGRHGWTANMDADVLWPKDLLFSEDAIGLQIGISDNPFLTNLAKGQLCTPRRRMWEDWPKLPIDLVDSMDFHLKGKSPFEPENLVAILPAESDWPQFPLHPQQQEFAGYTQIFHAEDPHLGPAPWHETNWKHAGGADSFFQQKWPDECKIRPPFEVLHLGPAGQNWCGRATPLADGTVPTESSERKAKLRNFIRGRVAGPNRFNGEKLL